VLKFIFKPLFQLLFDVKISGRENIPTDSSYIIAYNHISVFEPPFILAFWPEFPEALAGHDVWDRTGIQGTMVKFFGAIPVKRGEYDRESMETMLTALRGGRPLMLSPEGGRSHDIGMRRAHPGIAYLVDRADVPVVPVAIVGTHDNSFKEAISAKRRPPFELRIGEPFRLPAITEKGKARREARQRNADQVMLHIGAMLPEKYHGVYLGQIKTGK
jgi:1-acyl-sn-glycerol-3-phosphate acyltransferase